MITEIHISKYKHFKNIVADVEIDGELLEIKSFLFEDPNGVIKSIEPDQIDDDILVAMLESKAYDLYQIRDETDDAYDAMKESY